MKQFKLLSLAAIAAVFLAMGAPTVRAQVSIGIQIGSPPVCPYGYFDYAPYNCAPFGYYAPDWFHSGAFIGAGPWYRGPADFHGWVNRRYDPQYGYRGGFPYRGEHADWGRHRGWEHNFHGDYEWREERHDNGNHDGDDNGYDHDRHDNGYDHDRHGNGHDHDHGH